MPTSFDALIANSKIPVLVDFWAEWCGPCRQVGPIIGQIAREYTDRLITVKVNIDRKQQIALHYQIESIPTIMLFYNSTIIMRLLGAMPYAEIKKQIDANWPGKKP